MYIDIVYDVFRFLLHLRTLFLPVKTVLKDFTVKSFLEILPPQVERRHVIDVEGSLPLPQTQQHVSARAVGNTAVVQQNRTEPSHHYAFIVRFKRWL